jgi:hypothetical protein
LAVVALKALGVRAPSSQCLQKRLVGLHVGHRAGVGLVPGVKLGLQAVALGQQGQVFRCQVGHDGIKALPENGRWYMPVPGNTCWSTNCSKALST